VKEMKIISLSPQNLGVIPLACHLHINEVAAICTGVWNQILTFRKISNTKYFLATAFSELAGCKRIRHRHLVCVKQNEVGSGQVLAVGFLFDLEIFLKIFLKFFSRLSTLK
jgi:hypothetical protein